MWNNCIKLFIEDYKREMRKNALIVEFDFEFLQNKQILVLLNEQFPVK